MTDYAAILYDLDGTLVRLDVDWAAVREECAAILREAGVEVDETDLWGMRTAATDRDLLERVDETIAEHERAGALTASRLPLADDLPHDVPVGVCSLNDTAACEIALEHHGLDVDVVVGRGYVETIKPEPEQLLAATDALGVDPARTLFVGDSGTDEEAAAAAGADFQWVEDRV